MAKTAQDRINAVIQRWTTELGLREEQKAKLLTVVTAREEELQQTRKKYKGKDNKELKASKLKEVRKKHRPKMVSLLDEAQAKKLKEMRKKKKGAKSA